jgi:WD40 repeat protein
LLKKYTIYPNNLLKTTPKNLSKNPTTSLTLNHPIKCNLTLRHPSLVPNIEEAKLGITSIQFDPVNKYLAAGLTDGSIEVYNMFTGELSFELNKVEESKDELFSTFLEVKYPQRRG